MIPESAAQATIPLPAIAALCVNAKAAFLLTDEGEIQTLPHHQAALTTADKPLMVCHAPYTRAKLGSLAEFHAFDVLELFAFIHPGQFATPTIYGLCNALQLTPPGSIEDAPFALMEITRALLSDLRNDPHSAKANPLEIARVMGLNGKGWAWTPFIFSALGETYDPAIPINSKTGLNIWKNLPEWAEEAPEPPPSHHAVSAEEARERLQKLLGDGAEQRQEQMDYAVTIANAFAPPHASCAPLHLPQGEGNEASASKRSKDGLAAVSEGKPSPNIILAEAGTGVGKTLGYLAPASLWAEKNKGTVWISTYTKNLQRQIDQELDRLYPDPTLKEAHVATRKGRENYLCLLNLEETANGAALAKHPQTAIAAGIMARWAVASKDGDLTGGGYPGWLPGILGWQHSTGLADRRGECIYSACDHYTKCFVEHSHRKAEHARIVVANHALVMINAALSNPGEDMPGRYVFDEGHHLFDAADSAFAAHLTAREARDLRRWILGPEGGKRNSRARGLKRRAEDLTEGINEAEDILRKILSAAECLPMDGWTRRLKDGAPSGPTEHFMAEIYRQIFARAEGREGPYSLETQVFPVDNAVIEHAAKLKTALIKLQKPMKELAKAFHKKLTDDDGALAADTRRRLEAVSTALNRRATMTLQAWIDMLENLGRPQEHNQSLPPSTGRARVGAEDAEFIDWLEVERIDGRSIDVGYYRHHIDPMQPFAASIQPHVHGMAVTSATLRDSEDWNSAQHRTGASYLNANSQNAAFDSPFDYAAQTKIFIVNDVNKNDMAQLAGAYRALFDAAGGGALGLFTAISRLRTVHEHIAPQLEERGIPLYAQHVDDIDAGTLVDMFREDEQACLLGTDAIRDGVDVPGKSLQLIAFDRVPWPRPTILHKARRDAFGGRSYDEMITRLKLKQAFGRLIRRADDKGVFVMLDSMLPTRLQSAFPKDVEIVKTGLSDIVEEIKAFL